MDLAFARNRPKFIPEDIFEADAGLVMADYNRAFYDPGLAASVVEVVVGRFERTVIMTMVRHGIPPAVFPAHAYIVWWYIYTRNPYCFLRLNIA